MYTIVRDLVIQLFHVPAGELTNWLLLCILGVGLIRLIFK